MRCKDRKTEVAVSMTGFIKCGTDVRFIYRIDQEQAVETPWRSHPSCYLALAPTHTKLRHNLGECLEEPLGPPGRWISAGWWCPPKLPVNPPIRRETLARSVCQGLLFTGWSCRM